MSVCVVGSLNVDWVLEVESLPRPGETLIASTCTRRLGGKGANQAVAAARAGSATRLVGHVGSDDGGKWLLEFLEAEHVDIAAVTRDDQAATGQAFICVDRRGENCIITVGGANARLPVPPDPGRLLASAHVLLAQLEICAQILLPVFAASVPGCIKILNAAPAIPAGRRLFTHVDVLVVNETELASYSQFRDVPAHTDAVVPAHADAEVPAHTDAVVAAARALLDRADQTVVVTRGALGALIVRGCDVQEIAGRTVAVVDTVGAGDCFCGVLAAGMDRGLSLEAAAARANVAAAIAVSRRGAAQAMPTVQEIDASMA
jgi:ribokinase